MHFHYRVTFTGYIQLFVLLRRMTYDLDLWPFRSWECFMYSAAHVRHTPIIIFIWLSGTELRVLNIWSHIRNLKQSVRMRRVTWPLTGCKNSLHFEILDPNLPIHFVTFTALRRRLSHVIGKKIAFSYYEGYKVYSACTVSRYMCIGDPKNHT